MTDWNIRTDRLPRASSILEFAPMVCCPIFLICNGAATNEIVWSWPASLAGSAGICDSWSCQRASAGGVITHSSGRNSIHRQSRRIRPSSIRWHSRWHRRRYSLRSRHSVLEILGQYLLSTTWQLSTKPGSIRGSRAALSKSIGDD